MSITAQAYVNRLRDLVQVFYASGVPTQYVDGFTDTISPGSGPTPLLLAINEYVSTLSQFKYCWNKFTYDAVAGTTEYPIDGTLFNVRSVLYNGKVLLQSSRDALEALFTNYSTTTGTPTRYYKEGQFINLYPTPSANLSSGIVVRGNVSEPVLTATTDTLTYLPPPMQYRVPYGAAIIMCAVDAGNMANAKRAIPYATIAAAMEAELAQMQQDDEQDFATWVSADNFMPQKGGRQYVRGFAGQWLAMQQSAQQNQPQQQGGG